ncbi:galactosylceramide sulfotransferase-like [Artemia franciscana]|uniref:galactosylceramide sulfotransferase-like n=1 Tax=Artemia franciscana TaxID=6661 RepID=UPI0032DA7FBB
MRKADKIRSGMLTDCTETLSNVNEQISYFYGIFFDMNTESLAFTNDYSNIYGYISGFDIFVEDTRWNFENVKNILGNDFISLTIMCDPVCQFESMFHFMHMETHYNVSSFEMFLEKLEAGKITNERFQIFGRNQLAYTLGFEETSFENNTAIKAIIEEIDRQFNLVIISEYFEESVIILKNILGTRIGQMTFVPLVVRTNDTKHKLAVKQRLLLEKWLNVDVRLYNTFKRSLERRFTKYVREEARILKLTNNAL